MNQNPQPSWETDDNAGETCTVTREVAFRAVDHIALAVSDLDVAITFFRDTLGFTLVRRHHVKGATTGMVSAEMQSGRLKFVLCQGTEPQSQVSRLVSNFGVGVAHIALQVDDVADAVDCLRARGMRFDTSVIEGPGLTQAFTSRDPSTGMSFELIKRSGEQGFVDNNIQALFEQMERSGSY